MNTDTYQEQRKEERSRETVDGIGPERTSMPLPSILIWAANVSQAECYNMGNLTVTASG